MRQFPASVWRFMRALFARSSGPAKPKAEISKELEFETERGRGMRGDGGM